MAQKADLYYMPEKWIVVFGEYLEDSRYRVEYFSSVFDFAVSRDF